MSVLVVGISHRSAPVSLLERLALDGDDVTKLVSDVLAGEPPARFRRRILMERAAWLVRQGDRTLLDIAIDSGFSRGPGSTSGPTYSSRPSPSWE